MTAAQLADHHPNVASQAVLTESVATCIDQNFMNRWRTLMSVDDVVAALTDAELQDFDNVYRVLDKEYKWTAGAEAFWLYLEWDGYHRTKGQSIEDFIFEKEKKYKQQRRKTFF